MGLPEGSHSFTATQTDVAGNPSGLSGASAMTVRVIALAPGVTLDTDTGLAGDKITSNGALKLSGVRVGAVVEYSIDNGATWTSAFSAHEGANSVRVRQTDVAGNVSSATTLAFTLDTAAARPGVALSNDTGASSTDHITASAALTLSGVEPGAMVQYSANGTTWSTTAPVLAQGSNTVFVRQIDVAGNASAATQITFTYDTQVAAPTVTLTTDSGVAGDKITNLGTFAVTGTETNALVEYSADGATWSATAPALTQGSNTVYVRQVDIAGNTSSATTLTFTLDTVAPSAPGVALANDTGASNSDHITSKGGLALGGIEPGATVQYSLDGGATWGSSFTAVEGANAVLVRQTDPAGNVSGSTAVAFTLDTTAATPVITVVIDAAGATARPIANGGTTADAHATLNGTADAFSAITVYDGPVVLGTTTADASGAWTFTPTAALGDAALHRFTVQAMDVAGNTRASTDYAVTVDTSGGGMIHAPVLAAALTTATYTDTVAADIFGSAPGVLTAVEAGVTTFAYTVTGVAAAPVLLALLEGYDRAAAGQYGTVYLNSISGAYVFVPDDAAINALPVNATATDNFTLWVSDGLGGTDSKALTIHLSGANDAPTLSASLTTGNYADTAATDVFSPLTGVLTSADVDAGETHTYGVNGVAPASPTLPGYDVAAAGLYGTVFLNSTTGAYTFVPDNAAINALPVGVNRADTFTLSVSDGLGGTQSKLLTINLTGANDAPAQTVSLTAASYVDTALKDVFSPVSGSQSVLDPDSSTFTFGVTGSTSATTASTRVGFNLAMAGNFGTLHLNSTSGAYIFVPDSAAINALPEGVDRLATFTLSVSDGSGGTDSKLVAISISGANDASVISGVSGPVNYSVGDPAPLVVAPSLKLGDVDSGLVTSATVNVSAGFRAGNDLLTFTLPTGSPITGTYDPQSGVLQFTGDATLLQYQAALASVQFSTTTAGHRTISFTVFDHQIASITVDTSSVSLDNLTTTGFRLPGTAENDTAGNSVSGAGDINGDGFADVIIGAPFADGGVGQGASYVVFGKSSAFVPELLLSSLNGTEGFRISGIHPYDAAGFSVSGAGDVNGDGFADMIIGAMRAGPNNTQIGESYVVFGNGNVGSNGVLDLSTLDGITNGFKITGAGLHDWAGYSVSSAGDLNGDGFADVIIGARYATAANGTPTGAAYVVFGHENSTPFGVNGTLGLSGLDGSNGFVISPPAAVELNSVSTAGDLNGDGFGDLMISATRTNTGGSFAAEAYVVLSGSGGLAANVDLSLLTGANGFHVSGLGEYSRARHTVAAAGDLNGDGFGDLVIGAPYATTANGSQSGAAYVIFGSAAGFAPDVNVLQLGASDGFRITGAAADNWAGYSVSAAGDVNGDGYGDLIVGAPNARLNGQPAGECYVIFGQAQGLAHDIDLSNLSPSDGFKLSAVGPGDASGYAVSAAGDVNGDGFDDLILAASRASPHGVFQAGESYVVFGSKFIVGTNTYLGTTGNDVLTGTSANDHLIGGQGNDTMIGGGGVDSFRGGSGDDSLHLGVSGSSDSRFLTIDGGSGFDTLVLDGSGMTLDLTASGTSGRVHGIERIDLTGSGSNALVLNIRDVLNISDTSNQLFVMGNAGDSVTSTAQGWARDISAPPVVDHGVTFDSYTLLGAHYRLGMANLLVEQQVTVLLS